MKILYLLDGARVLRVGAPILIPGTAIKPDDALYGVKTVACHVPTFGTAHDAALALLSSGAAASWCLSRDACSTPPTARKGKFVLPSTWSFQVFTGRVREVTERKTAYGMRTTIHITPC